MRKLISLFIFLVFILSGCQSLSQNTIIDWVDFIKWDGKMYEGINTCVIADEKHIDKKLGEVKFKVADNVSDPEYKTKNGDAAFHEKGTDIFTIKGEPNLLAVKSSRAINGYNLYYSRDEEKNRWQFKDMPAEKVIRIEIYQENTANGTKRITEIKNINQINHLLQILKTSKDSPSYQPNMKNGDPDMFQIVLYTGDPVAYMFPLQFDGHNYFWFPSETSILSDEIQGYIPR
ncbi:hypothetical protein [Neobacillus sp. SuZ13]|uniref:hypothetical protein n=1 Tax=Neobacillus sp. SuZ13 TaxID=3047875 RepID=UPI0024BF8AED|nr:hypothetical protein [Neobacillus sp. SuZ13]WHY64493.1 hypothetical protein QNH17_15275 [Neobacillus sp. SuZ13]